MVASAAPTCGSHVPAWQRRNARSPALTRATNRAAPLARANRPPGPPGAAGVAARLGHHAGLAGLRVVDVLTGGNTAAPEFP